jgi:hypothetical protein
MESRKILRLEFVSDKIEGGDCKRDVIYICFGHIMKKNGCPCVLSVRAERLPFVRRRGGWRKERKKEKEGKEKKKRKKYGNFSKLEIFQKIKDNL